MIEFFEFEGKQVRFVGTAEKPEWVAKDVCLCLGLSDTSRALEGLEDSDRGTKIVRDTSGREQEMLTVFETGLYALVFKSRKDEAKRFKRWTFEEVLPSIRKTGSYSISQQHCLPQTYLEALKCLVKSEEEKVALEAEIKHQKLLNAVKEEELATQKEKLNEWHPLVKNYEDFIDSEGLISMAEGGKMLDSGRNRLIQVLRLYGFLLQDKNEPYQKWMKHFKVKMKVRNHPDKNGNYKSDPVTLFTPKGFNSVVKIMEARAGSRERLLEYLKKPEYLETVLNQIEREKHYQATNAVEEVLEDVNF